MKLTFTACLLALALTASASSLEEAIRLYKDKNYEQAETLLREARAENPDSAEASYYLGATLVELKKYEEADQYLEGVAEDKPEARVALGKSYMLQEKLDNAMRTLDMAAKALPDNAEIWLYRGMIHLKRDRFSDAAKQLAKAIELDPKLAHAHYYFGMANSRIKRPDLMVKHFQLFLELAPDAAEAPKVRSLLRSL